MIFADRPEYRQAVKNAVTIIHDDVDIVAISPQDLIVVKELGGPIDLLDIESIRQEYS